MSKRPLSPHLLIYRPQLTSVLSITHRATGIVLSLGTLLFALWLLALAQGPAIYAKVQVHLQSWYGHLALLGWTWALYYHLCNGVRHLFWDMGKGLELRATYASGWAVVAASLGLTVLTWLCGIYLGGGLP